jgi:hypothetical protein
MSWKQLSQSSLADSLASHHKSLEELDDIHELLDWTRIEAHLKDMFSSKRGEPAWPPLLMFKIMLLQQWYGLSDEGMEKQLARDLLFRRFTGLGLSDGTPDHTEKQKQANTWRSQVRNRVESVFGILKLHYGLTKARHRGLMQLHTSIGFAVMAYNLKRAVKIQNSCA